MKRKDFKEILEELLIKEGGYVYDKNDLGGETKYGITFKTARAYGYKGSIAKLDKETACKIYEDIYWKSNNLDKINNISPEIAESLFDISVNLGVSRAGLFFQRALNLLNKNTKLQKDTIIGPRTLKSFVDIIEKRENNIEVILKMLNCLKGAHYINISEARIENRTFIRGWFLKRIK